MAKIVNGFCTWLNRSDAKIITPDALSASDFSCGNEELDAYLKTRAYSDTQCVTYYFEDNDDGAIIAFASLCCSGIVYQDETNLSVIPAVQIKYFAVAEQYQHVLLYEPEDDEDRFCISDHILCEVIALIREKSDSVFGATHAVLYSVPDAVSFYKRNAFDFFDDFMTPEKNRHIDGCIPMYTEL